MIVVLKVRVNGQVIPIGKRPVVLLDLDDLATYRNELWEDIARQKGVEFNKEEAFSNVTIDFKEYGK
jgi:hypothetical protein